MQQSESINELATALSKAQGKMGAAKKDAVNPFFKSKYSDLASVIAAARPALVENGLAVSQMTDFDEEGREFVETEILHSSGQWLRGRLLMHPKDLSPQAQGSSLSYSKRYALQAALMLPSDEDDDGEQAMGRANQGPVRTPTKPKADSAFLKTLEVKPMPPDDLPKDWDKEVPPSPIPAPKTAQTQAFRESPLPIGVQVLPETIELMVRSAIKAKGMPDYKVKELLKGFGRTKIRDLNESQAAMLIRQIEWEP